MSRNARLAVAVSGGADSLSAFLALRDGGREPLAVHALLHEETPDLSVFPADQLLVVDLRREFARHVTGPFAAEYASGRTPNPCARCNPAIKFGALLDAALAAGCGRLATGHYARLERDTHGRTLLMPALDQTKDQSYFLALVPPERLALTEFPLGGLTKREVLAELGARGVRPPIATESQDVCFLKNAGEDYRDWLERQGVALSGPGPILLADPESLAPLREIGVHRGLWAYTQGQRKGLNVAWSEPLYVVGKDPAANALLAGPKAATLCAGFATGPVNELVPLAEWPEIVAVRTRYRQRPSLARIEGAHVEGTRDGLRVSFLTPAERPAPGQLFTAQIPGQAPEGQPGAGSYLGGAIIS